MSDMSEIKNLIDAQGKAWEEFKAANDARLKAIEEKGYAPADLVGKVDIINADIAKLGKEIQDLMKKANRPGIGGGDISPEQVEHKQAWQRWARKGDEGSLRDIEHKAMTVSSDPDGGYFVPIEMEQGIERLLIANVAMVRIADNRVIGSASYKRSVRTSGAGYVWVGETEEPGETSTPKYAQLEFVPGTIAAEPRVSQELLEDAEISIESEIMDALDEAFSDGIGAAFINGNGIKKPRGLLTYPTVANASYAWGKLGYIASGASGAFAASNPSDQLIDLVHALKAGYRTSASWLMNDLTLSAIRKFKDGQGNYLWVPGIQNGVSGILLGYPVETDDYMPDVAANSLSIAFGDFRRGYIVVRRRGVAMLRDPYTAKPFVKFYTTLRIGGGVKNFEAIKLMKFASS